MPKVLVIEDVAEDYESIEKPLKALLGKSVKVDRYKHDVSSRPLNQAVDERLREEADELGLVILDLDLTKYPAEEDRKRAHISSGDIQTVCQDLGIPLVVYAVDNPKQRIAHSKWNESHIFIPKPNKLAELRTVPDRMAMVYRGMAQIRKEVGAFLRSPDWKRRDVLNPEFLQKLMKGPAAARQAMEAYSWGHFEITANVRAQDVKQATRDDMVRYYATALGYWILNVVMPFPGMLAHQVAAASYLGVRPKDLDAADLSGLLKAAEYSGPFADSERYWWVVSLDDLLSILARKHGAPGKLDALAAEVNRKLQAIQCAHGHAGAGFYCVWTKEPICERHSVGDARTVPRCATLARVDKARFLKSGPWFVH